MKKEIVKLICKNLKWHERIIVKIHSKLFEKVYSATRFEIVNKMIN